jgi:DNA polymerase-3 subunit delta
VAAKTTGKSKPDSVPHAFDFLANKEPTELPCILIAQGPDDFLRRESIEHALKLASVDPLGVARFDGDEALWRDVNDELSTQSLFDTSGPKAAYIRKADSFVSSHREQIERWLESASPGSTLLLDMQTLASNTRIYRLAQTKGLLITTAEKKGKELQAWISHWAESKHDVILTDKQAALIADRIGYVGGLIDCELAKLALFTDAKRKISDARIDELVGGWRTQTVWKLSEAVADGRVAEAIEGVDKLIMSGQSVVGLAAQMSWSMRRYGVAATWLDQQKRNGNNAASMGDALGQAGFRYDVFKEETRLKRIGWNRAKEILGWLVELEKGLKGSHSQDDRARLALERFIFRFR